VSRGSQECPDIVHDVRSPAWGLYYPPDYEGDGEPPKDCLKIHVAS